MAELESIQFSKIIISEEELIANKLNQDGLAALFAPRIDVKKRGVFYFSCYNKLMDSLTFSKKIPLFKAMYISELDDVNTGQIRSFDIEAQ